LVKIYEEVLSESGAKSCIARFGKELFDPQLSRDGKDIEPNTKTEDNYLELISQFTLSHHGKESTTRFVNAMGDLKSCMSAYPEVLKPEGVAYRGTSMHLSKLLNQFDDITDDLRDGGEFSFTYKPNSLVQSWTADEYTAEGFTNKSSWLVQYINKYEQVKDVPEELEMFIEGLILDMDNITCPIVVSLKTNKDDFLFKAKHFMFLSQHEYEEEFIRINNRPTRVNARIVRNLFEPVYEILTALKKYAYI